MKNKLKSILAAALCCGFIAVVGCSTTQQTNSYKTIYTVESAATAAYNGYCTAVIQGIAATNNLPSVSRKYNQIQLACTLAAASGQAGGNALAPDNLTAELAALNSLISSLTSPNP